MSTDLDPKEVWRRYTTLAPSVSADKSSSALPLNFSTGSFLCRAADGAPFFLIPLTDPSGRDPFRLKYVTFDFDRKFEIKTEAHSVEGLYVSISCSPEIPELHQFFVQSISAILQTSAAESSLELSDRLRALFSSQMTGPSEGTRGLWGELLYIRSCSRPQEAVLAWHRNPLALYDFEFADKSVEIKTTAGNKRSHSFSYSQLHHAKANDELVSVMLRQGDSGETAQSLIDDILGILDPRSAGVFLEKLLPILGSQNFNLDDENFVVKTTLEDTRVFNLAEIKCPSLAVPGKGLIIGLQITVDLSNESGLQLI